jgi:hypothetical protein
MQFFKASMILSIALLFSTGSDAKTIGEKRVNVAPKEKPRQRPKVILTSIKNDTPSDLLLVDRLADPETTCAWHLRAGKTTKLNLQVNTATAIVMDKSMTEVMLKDAQYVLISLGQSGAQRPDQEVYFNLHLAQGGIDDGSGIITGSLGTTWLRLNVVDKKGSCSRQSNLIQNPACKRLKFELVLELDEDRLEYDQFPLHIDGTLL